MTQLYQLTGSQQPGGRIDRVVVENATGDHPEKVLELDGEPKQLSDEQYARLSGFVRLRPIEKAEARQLENEPELVDQPGVQRTSTSTDVPPDPGTTPEVGSLNKDELALEVERVRLANAGAMEGVTSRSSKEDMQKALRRYYGQEA